MYSYSAKKNNYCRDDLHEIDSTNGKQRLLLETLRDNVVMICEVHEYSMNSIENDCSTTYLQHILLLYGTAPVNDRTRWL